MKDAAKVKEVVQVAILDDIPSSMGSMMHNSNKAELESIQPVMSEQKVSQ
jgi:hypothetical protein